MNQKENLKTNNNIYIFHVQYIMSYILIQVNESIAKLVTLMVHGFKV
jgi:hypothetical protein